MAGSRFHHLSGATLAAALASATLLAGCGRHHMAPAQEVSAPAARPDALAGAPVDGPAAPAEAPPSPAYAAPPPAARPGDQDVIYDLGPVVRGHDTMAPIPNPPEHARRSASRSAESRPSRRVVRPHARTPHHAPRHASHPAPHAAPARPAPAAPHAKPAHVAPAHGAAARAATHPATHPPATPAHGTAPAAHPAVTPHDAKPLASDTSKAASQAKAHPGKGKATPTAATGERATKLAALQTSLKDAVAKTALLNAPDLKPDQPADVTLTLPAGFASTVRDESEKQGLRDAAASVNMTALLSGDGYAVAPDEVQSQPLTVGQPTEFHWTVTAQPGAKGGLHADVGADLLGGGDDALQLGSVTPSGKGGLHISPRAWGAGLLVLLAVAVFAFLSRGRGRAESARRRQRSSTNLYQRPLDMGEGAPPPPRTDREL